MFVQVDTTDPPFPRNAGYWWFGCRAESKHGSKNNRVNPQESASEYRPSLLDLRKEHNVNQNTDVGDLQLDAGKNFWTFLRNIIIFEHEAWIT